MVWGTSVFTFLFPQRNVEIGNVDTIFIRGALLWVRETSPFFHFQIRGVLQLTHLKELLCYLKRILYIM